MDKEFRTRLRRILTWKAVRENMAIAMAVRDKVPGEEIEAFIEAMRNRQPKIDLTEITSINVK